MDRIIKHKRMNQLQKREHKGVLVLFFRPLLLISLLALSQSCQKEGGYRDIRGYYYPLKELQEGLVYEYRAEGMPELGSSYWYFRFSSGPKGNYLYSTFYEQDMIPAQQLKEEVVSNGLILRQLYLYGRDSLPGGRQNRSEAEIISPSVFPFRVREHGGIFLYHVRWQDPGDASAWYTVIKNRYFAGDTTFVFEGKTYPAVNFELKEHFELDQIGVFESTYSGMEIYAKGLGLVYFRKEIQENMMLAYRLESRFPVEKLEERFRSQYPSRAESAEKKR
ncbi:MAG: hypothetical protein IPN74_05225 [Haliscomenobacter sp.]|nr:hypothetical protein [Haliscomenobacter sp.]